MSILDDFDGEGDLRSEFEMSCKKDASLESKLDKIETVYSDWLNNFNIWGVVGSFFNKGKSNFQTAFNNLEALSITDMDIYSFPKRMKTYSNCGSYSYSGLFLSAMIQRAYQDDYIKFNLNLNDVGCKFLFVGSYLQGRKKKQISLLTDGSVNNFCGTHTKFAKLYFNGQIGAESAQFSEQCYFTFNGDVGAYCGENTKNVELIFNAGVGFRAAYKTQFSRLILNGPIGNYFGENSEYSEFIIHSPVNEGCGFNAKYCVFVSDDKNTLKQTKKNAKSSCRHYHLMKDGTKKPYNLRTKIIDRMLKEKK